MRKLAILASLVVTLGLALAACGGGDDDSGGGTTGGTSASGTQGKKGGTLTVMALADVDSLDPGYQYYTYSYMALSFTTQKMLYGWKPDAVQPTPDLAEALPQVSDDGKTLTITIKDGIKYSPPLQDRTVKASDVKYAMERSFLPQVANGYVGVYWNSISGVKAYQDGKADEVSGLVADDAARTLTIKLDQPSGVLSTAQALAMPGTAPVPKDYAAKYDKPPQSKYGLHVVSTGPYMLPNDASGKVTGFTPNKTMEIVRNPSWDPKTDYRPAYLDKIIFSSGNDITVASRKVLTGQSMVSGDYAAPPTAVLKQGLANYKDQLKIEPSQGIRFISLNTKIKPMDDLNFRSAVTCAINKLDLRVTRGGEVMGPIATHFIPPEIPGYEESGGPQAPEGVPCGDKPEGDLAQAAAFMQEAGFPSGKYTGEPLLMVGDNQPPASKTGEAVQQQLEAIGIKLNYRQVQHPTMLSKFCGVPKAAVVICPNLGWGKDFFDAESLINPVFNGNNIIPQNNANYAQLDDPALNAKMAKAQQILDVKGRAEAWAEINKEVSKGAYLVPWLWDNQVNLMSKNVNGVRNKFNSSFDLAFTSLK